VRGEGVEDTHTLDRLAVPKILDEENAHAGPADGRPQINGGAVALTCRSVGSIDQNAAVEADHRSCISSRLKRLPPIGNPFRIIATICSMARSRSRFGDRYGAIIATGSQRRVFTPSRFVRKACLVKNCPALIYGVRHAVYFKHLDG